MKKILILFIGFTILSCEKDDKQEPEQISQGNTKEYIIAGHTKGYYYTDLVADTTISTLGKIGESAFNIDLDFNDSNDFIVKAYFSTGTSHDIAKITIQPLDSNKVAFADSVPATYGNDTAFYVNLVKGVNYGDTINSNLKFKNEELYLKTESNVTLMYQVNASWNNGGYIPVCIDYGDDQVYYGWIKVSSVSTREITIESYAVNL